MTLKQANGPVMSVTGRHKPLHTKLTKEHAFHTPKNWLDKQVKYTQRPSY